MDSFRPIVDKHLLACLPLNDGKRYSDEVCGYCIKGAVVRSMINFSKAPATDDPILGRLWKIDRVFGRRIGALRDTPLGQMLTRYEDRLKSNPLERYQIMANLIAELEEHDLCDWVQDAKESCVDENTEEFQYDVCPI